MGALGVAEDGGVLRTLLGSCVGLVLYERRLKIGGLAHIVLPKAPAGHTDTPGKFVDTAVPALIRKMEELAGGATLKLCAKLAGGANMFNTTAANTIGEQNIEAAERHPRRDANSGDRAPPGRRARAANDLGHRDRRRYH